MSKHILELIEHNKVKCLNLPTHYRDRLLRRSAGAGHFLELSFGVQQLSVRGKPMHAGWVRYFGVGRMVACFHVEPIAPNSIALPPPEISLSVPMQQAWLQQELQELAEVRPRCASIPLKPMHYVVNPRLQELMQASPVLVLKPRVLCPMA